MALLTTLQIEPLGADKEPLKVINCDFPFSQMIDATGKPVSNPQGGCINVTVETDGKNNDLFEWMIDPVMQKSGLFIFYHSNGESRFKTVKFKDAFCVGYHETFDFTGENHRLIKLTISARRMIMNDIEPGFINNWPSP